MAKVTIVIEDLPDDQIGVTHYFDPNIAINTIRQDEMTNAQSLGVALIMISQDICTADGGELLSREVEIKDAESGETKVFRDTNSSD